MRILLISDIHGNFPALRTIASKLSPLHFDHILNCGDSLVYAPFPNETLYWLRENNVISILGNTDRKVIKLLKGKSFRKPGKPEKRIMYTTTAEELTKENRKDLRNLKKSISLDLPLEQKSPWGKSLTIGLFHGSPADHNEFLFDSTPKARFEEMAATLDVNIVVTGHSHTPYHKVISGIHFINPGSVGRMFDNNPAASCAILEITTDTIQVKHLRISYPVSEVITGLENKQLPEIYCRMFEQASKLN